MTSEERKRRIKSLLAANGQSVVGIARSVGKTREYIHRIIINQRTGYKYRPAIAKACKVSVSDLWSDTPS